MNRIGIFQDHKDNEYLFSPTLICDLKEQNDLLDKQSQR